jgi:gliding motility-associated-like protein
VNDPLVNTNPPIANSDLAVTLINTPVSTNVLANDKSTNIGTSLNTSSVSIVTKPSHGTATVNPTTGAITFTPAAGYVGTDSLVYNVCDNATPTAICNSATVYYSINASNTNPVTIATDDFASTLAGNTISGNVINNDLNTSGAVLVITAVAPVPTNKGQFVMNTNGSYNFIPATGFTGTIDIAYTVCGGSPSVCSSATLHLLVEPIIPTKILDVTKIANSAKMNLDGSFNIGFVIKVQNLTTDYLDSVLLKDDLTKVFTDTRGISVVSVEVSGKLLKNSAYNGINNTDLLAIQSAIDAKKADSVILTINVASSTSGNFANTAVASAPTAFGLISSISTDPTRVISSTDTTRKPTLFNVPKVEVMIPASFSPNNDGFNDTWMIARPFGTTISVKVFNRWGNEVYSSAEYKNDWRGKGVSNFLGEDVPEGTYYYVVEATDFDHVTRKFAGSLTIVR